MYKTVLGAICNRVDARLTAQAEEAFQANWQLLDPDKACPMGAEIVLEVPDHATRHDILTVLLRQSGDSEATQYLLDSIKELWETMDLLRERFGPQVARTIIDAAVSFPMKEAMCS